MLFISIQLTSKYVSQRIKMQKAETVNSTFSFRSKIAQVPMRSYCHEVLADGGGLQSFWGADVPACWDCVVQTGFRWAQQASGASGKSQAYAKGLFHQQPLWWKMGFFFVWRNFLENIVALFGCAKQQLTSSKGDRISWSKGLPCLQQLLFPLTSHLSLLQ